jgi:hypothetical protein
MNLLPQLIGLGMGLLPDLIDAVLPDQDDVHRDLIVGIFELILDGEVDPVAITEILAEAFVDVAAWSDLQPAGRERVVQAVVTLSQFITELPSRRRRKVKVRKGRRQRRRD